MIRVNQLHFTYAGADQAAVKDVAFDIAEGEIFGFLGPSGAGKSTTQKILIRLLKGYEGKIEVMEKSLDQWSHDYYEEIGVGFELPNHYTKLSAIENLNFFGSFYQKAVKKPEELLEMVGLEEHGKKMISEYSKGMKMRLNFVRSLMHDPSLLFFDEPTSGLDPGNARIIKDIILDLKQKGKTIFLTTHDMATADELCDRIAFMVDGQLATIQSPKELKLEHGRRRVKLEYGTPPLQTAEFALDGLGTNEAFLNILKEDTLQTIHSEEATLEDIFIKVTGKSLT
ncbi:MAG: ABC transporter ATP-binding protein [Bacteroidota bacterium]